MRRYMGTNISGQPTRQSGCGSGDGWTKKKYVQWRNQGRRGRELKTAIATTNLSFQFNKEFMTVTKTYYKLASFDLRPWNHFRSRHKLLKYWSENVNLWVVCHRTDVNHWRILIVWQNALCRPFRIVCARTSRSLCSKSLYHWQFSEHYFWLFYG